ncbi:MAG TPA: 2-succinyl-5-enolpyruvyl-6-hydroxy-3-cyclohexene-1-carboxylic-acid synthase [Bacteroidales bacterium]|nr:2-succinyl-5-enolpyruvyl-6-hydroxy-3-cyclohexene-1-carboxylic-acid synthase [Bacteroidales bacterium]
MIHPKSVLLHLAEMLINRGIRHLVVSPGSRNAPLVSVLCTLPGMKTFTVVDERSAGFFALGIAQQTGEPVAVTCTSGTAVLNYGPAVAEAFYQRIPLLLLTADRPPEWVDQADGQTIRQNGVFALHVRKSVSLPAEVNNQDDLWYAVRLCSEALNALSWPVAGPVHINMPFREPLYNLPDGKAFETKDIRVLQGRFMPGEEELSSLAEAWNACKRKMILVGQMMPDAAVQRALQQLADDPSVIVLTETTSNVYDPRFIRTIDRCLSVMQEQDSYMPEILLTFGGQVISKRIKAFLRRSSGMQHWHIDPSDTHPDTYQHLSLSIPAKPADMLPLITARIRPCESTFAQQWQQLQLRASALHEQYLRQCGFADFKVFELIFRYLPNEYDIQLSNSTPVRYAQLFDHPAGRKQFANRGTSGIDGNVSTAAGAAWASGRPTLLITGDLAFFYDTNGLWHHHLTNNLKIIVIHNGGGGIFRFIDGPSDSGLLERFFEAAHQTSVSGIAQTYGLDYHFADNEHDLSLKLPNFFASSARPAIFEVRTPAAKSASMLKCYFEYLANNSSGIPS